MLFLKECKKTVFSLTFLIYCILLFLFFFIQYFQENKSEAKPVMGEDFYGYKIADDEEIAMNGALNGLLTEYAGNQYICYPVGFYKVIRLSEKDRNTIEEYIQELSGKSLSEIEKIIEDGEKYYDIRDIYGTEPIYAVENQCVAKEITYKRFTEIMDSIDKILGGGSDYAPDSLKAKFSRVPMTYEDAVEEYNSFVYDDKVTGGLVRVFCDYTGITLAFIPVFVAAALTAADRRSKMREIVWSRKISSVRIVFTRYAALVVTMYIPVLVTQIIVLLQAMILYREETLDIPVMFTLPAFWLIPAIMISTAVGMLLTEIFSVGVAIAVQGIWAFVTLITTGGATLSGCIGKFDLMCRHNTMTERDVFLAESGDFIFNRIFYMVLALVVTAAACCVYNLKRGGRFSEIRLPVKNRLIGRKA